MKKIFVVLMLCIFLAGCGAAAKNSGFYEHDSMYKDWGHLWFSWYGHKKCTPEEAQKMVKTEGWWGLETCTIP